MKITEKMSIEITEDELKKIIVRCLERKGFRASSENVRFHKCGSLLISNVVRRKEERAEKGCGTCKQIENINECNRRFATGEREITDVLRVSLQTVSFNKENVKVGRAEFRDRPLRFCPECGTRIDRSKTVWRM